MAHDSVEEEKKYSSFPTKKRIQKNGTDKCVDENKNSSNFSTFQLRKQGKEIDKIPLASSENKIELVSKNNNDINAKKYSQTVSNTKRKRDTKSERLTKKSANSRQHFSNQQEPCNNAKKSKNIFSNKVSSLNGVPKLSVSLPKERTSKLTNKQDKTSIKANTPVSPGKKGKQRKQDSLANAVRNDIVHRKNGITESCPSTQSKKKSRKRIDAENNTSKTIDDERKKDEENTESAIEEPHKLSDTKDKHRTPIQPFSFDVRVKEYLSRRDVLAQGPKFEWMKWYRPPEILKKKPFSIKITKRYILPEFDPKFKTDERILKRPKFTNIYDEKQKKLAEQKQIQEMMEIKMLRKTLLVHPSPLPKYIMRSLEEIRKARRGEYFEEEKTSECELASVAQVMHAPKSILTAYSTSTTTKLTPETTSTIIAEVGSNKPIDSTPIDHNSQMPDENTPKFQCEIFDEPETKIETVNETKKATDFGEVELKFSSARDENTSKFECEIVDEPETKTETVDECREADDVGAVDPEFETVRDENPSKFECENVDEPDTKMEIVNEPKQATDFGEVEPEFEAVRDENMSKFECEIVDEPETKTETVDECREADDVGIVDPEFEAVRDENTSKLQCEIVDEAETKIETASEPREAVDIGAVEPEFETAQNGNTCDEEDEHKEDYEDEFLESESNESEILIDDETKADNEEKSEETAENDSKSGEPATRMSTYRLLLSALGRKFA